MKSILIKILIWLLKKLSQLTIWHFKPQIIAITGSAGKTSAKEAIYAVLKNYHRVKKSEGNLNNELGIPLAIIGDFSEEELKLVSRDTPRGKKKFKKLFFWFKVIAVALIRILFLRKSAYPQILILEYAADRPEDIKYLLKIARPRIGIITAVGEIPVHVEFFSSPEAVVREKAKIIEILLANNFAVLNFDDKIVMEMEYRTRAKIITFGFEEGANVKISSFENRFQAQTQINTDMNIDKRECDEYIGAHQHNNLRESTLNNPYGFTLVNGVSFKLEYAGSFVPVILKNVFGRVQAYAAAIAAAVGLIYDLNLVEISEALSANYKPIKSRMNLINGIKDTYIIDDTYNASPISMTEALQTLKNLSAKRKIAVLGDMLELGKYSIEAHENIGKLAGGIADVLITIGPRSKFIAESAEAAGLNKNMILIFDTINEACQEVQTLIKKGDLILIKASRAMALEKIVEEIKKIEAD